MKKTIALSFFIPFCGFVFSQINLDTTKSHYNEFGLDITSFIVQFTGTSEFYYDPTLYYVTYRRHLKPGNIRLGISGNYSKVNLDSYFPNDTNDNDYLDVRYSITTRLGWEFRSELSKRWQVYYGADLLYSYDRERNDAAFLNAGYANGSDRISKSFGGGPVLGLRFRITPRLSLITEATFLLLYQETTNRRYFTPVNGDYPEIPEETDPATYGLQTWYGRPFSLYVTFDL